MTTTDERRKAFYNYIKQQKKEGNPIKASGLIDHLVDEFSDYSRKEHRRFVQQELAGKEVDEKEKEQITKICPKCIENKTGKKKKELDDDQIDKLKQEDDVSYAEGEKEIDELFGFRKMSGGSTRPQSYCKDCRNS